MQRFEEHAKRKEEELQAKRREKEQQLEETLLRPHESHLTPVALTSFAMKDPL